MMISNERKTKSLQCVNIHERLKDEGFLEKKSPTKAGPNFIKNLRN